MAGSAQVLVNVNIFDVNNKLIYQNQPVAFQPTVTYYNEGPTPGTILATKSGTDISLSALTHLGGLCVITNLDPTNYVTYGIWDSVSGKFYPLGEVYAGEAYVLRLSRIIGQEYTGTGTNASGGDSFRFKSPVIASVPVKIEAFGQ